MIHAPAAAPGARAGDDGAGGHPHPVHGQPEDPLAPALGALVQLFCARFMPGVQPPRSGADRAR